MTPGIFLALTSGQKDDGVRACVAKTNGAPPALSAQLELRLGPNRPNPFNPSTTIQFDLPQATIVQLEVFDMLGRRVATLIDGALESGTHEVSWNGISATGSPVAGGVYLYRLRAGGDVQTRTMTWLK